MDIRVRTKVNQKKEGVSVLRDGRLRVAVRADRSEGKANLRVRELIALHFGVSLGNVHIISGHTQPTKQVKVMK